MDTGIRQYRLQRVPLRVRPAGTGPVRKVCLSLSVPPTTTPAGLADADHKYGTQYGTKTVPGTKTVSHHTVLCTVQYAYTQM